MSKIYPHPTFPDVKLLELGSFQDDRGWMARISDRELFEKEGIPTDWAQISHSHTAKAGVLRGIFVSCEPFREAKLVRSLRGRMQWVLVDLRSQSETFGRWGEVLLTEDAKNAFYAPKGFAHACLCLEDKTDLLLMADCPFSPAHSTGLRWDDPELGILWRRDGLPPLQISPAHQAYGSFKAYLSSVAT